MIPGVVAARLELANGVLEGGVPTERYLHDLEGCFADPAAYARACVEGNPLIYRVSTLAPESAPGSLHIGLGTLMPGRVGNEYYQTRGHLHARREAAEVYMGLAGEGVLLLEAEGSGEGTLVPLRAGTVVHVPGHTAHRTVNLGQEPLKYLGIYPGDAGHDYQALARRNFRHVVLVREGVAVLVERAGRPEVRP